MKILFDRKLLSEVFPPLLCAVSNKSTLSAIEGVLIEADEKSGNSSCVLTTYDTEKGIRITVDAKVFNPGKYIINAQKFSQIIRVMDSDEVELSIDERLTAKIAGGKFSHKMSALAGEDFPAIPDISHDKGFVIPQGIIKKMLSQVSYAMGVNDTRPVLNGCHFRVEGNKLTLVACDSINLAKSVRMTEIQNKNSDGSALDYSFIVPVKMINELSKLLSDSEDDMAEIYMTRKNIVFVIGEITFFSRLIDGEYLDYNRIILKNHKIKVELDHDGFLAALERAALVTEERVAGSVQSHVRLEFAGNILRVMANSAAGSTYDELDIDHVGDDIVIGFNNRFLINCVRACEGERVKLSLSSSLTSMNVEPCEEPENGEELFMLLPVKMKE